MNYNKILTIISVLMLLSCGSDNKGENFENNAANNIIQALNKEDPDLALKLSEEAIKNDPKNLELFYWKSQAYTMKAQIDIYTLFPILQFQLFDYAMEEWESVRKIRDRENSAQDIFNDGSALDKLYKRKSEIEKVEESKVEYEVIQVSSTEFISMYEVKSCIVNFKLTSNLIEYIQNPFIQYDVHFDLPPEFNDCSTYQDEVLKEVESSFPRWVKLTALQNIEYYIERKKEAKYKQAYMNAVFSIFDAIPMLKKLKFLEDDNANDLIEALKLFDWLQNQKDIPANLKNNALKHQGLLAGYLVISSFASSIDLSKVKSPADIICKTDSKALTKKYRYIKLGLIYFLKAIKGSEFEERNKKGIEDLKLKIEKLPEEVPENFFDIFQLSPEISFEIC